MDQSEKRFEQDIESFTQFLKAENTEQQSISAIITEDKLEPLMYEMGKYYRAFYNWSYLQAKGLVDYNSANPIESTVYLKVLFESGSDTMSYKRTLNESVSVNDNTVETAYWGCYQGWVGITNTKRCDHITKNGIIN